MMKNAYGAPPGASSAGTGQFMPSYGAGAGVGANIGAVAGGPPSGRSRIVGAAESAWLQVAATAQLVGDLERAQSVLELVLRHNPYHAGAYVRLGHLLHNSQQYAQAAEAYQKAITLVEAGQVGASLPATWAALAHCWLLLDDLPRAFQAYQQALSYPGGARDSTLWFGVGLLYDRYGADEHALEAFAAVLKLEGYMPTSDEGTGTAVDNDGGYGHGHGHGRGRGNVTVTTLSTKSALASPTTTGAAPSSTGAAKVPSPMIREAFYRIGCLLRNRGKWEGSRHCFEFLLHYPPAPLGKIDVRLQLAMTLEASGAIDQAISILQSIETAGSGSSGSISGGGGSSSNSNSSSGNAIAVNLATGLTSSAGSMQSIGSPSSGASSPPTSSSGRKGLMTRVRTLLAWFTLKRYHLTTVSGGGTLDVGSSTSSPPAPPLAAALESLKQIVADDGSDALSWYFLGRAHYLLRNYSQAYEAYQEAVYRDGQNAAFWNSIGILYAEIRQYRDALDAFSRAIHTAGALSEVWWNLGVLYEACNHQSNDAIDAFARAAELAPDDEAIVGRLVRLRGTGAGTGAGTGTGIEVEGGGGGDTGNGGIPTNTTTTTTTTALVPSELRELDPYPFVVRPILLGATSGSSHNGKPSSMTGGPASSTTTASTVPMATSASYPHHAHVHAHSHFQQQQQQQQQQSHHSHMHPPQHNQQQQPQQHHHGATVSSLPPSTATAYHQQQHPHHQLGVASPPPPPSGPTYHYGSNIAPMPMTRTTMGGPIVTAGGMMSGGGGGGGSGSGSGTGMMTMAGPSHHHSSSTTMLPSSALIPSSITSSASLRRAPAPGPTAASGVSAPSMGLSSSTGHPYGSTTNQMIMRPGPGTGMTASSASMASGMRTSVQGSAYHQQHPQRYLAAAGLSTTIPYGSSGGGSGGYAPLAIPPAGATSNGGAIPSPPPPPPAPGPRSSHMQ